MTIELQDGRRLHKFIAHAIGSLEVPMSDQDLARKFTDLAEGILPSKQSERVIELCWGMEELKDVADITRAGVAV
jgi:2-methylcitrate dehydratase PrpD